MSAFSFLTLAVEPTLKGATPDLTLKLAAAWPAVFFIASVGPCCAREVRRVVRSALFCLPRMKPPPVAAYPQPLRETSSAVSERTSDAEGRRRKRRAIISCLLWTAAACRARRELRIVIGGRVSEAPAEPHELPD